MADPRLDAYRVVILSFHADPDVKFPKLPVHTPGEKLSLDFFDWLRTARILAAPVGGGTSGGGRFSMALFPADAARALAWWKEHGVDAGEPFDEWGTENLDSVFGKADPAGGAS